MIYLAENHELNNAVTLKEECNSHFNNAWICIAHGRINFKNPGARGNNRYLKGEIEAHGFNFDLHPAWHISENGQTDCMGGVNYEGWLEMGTVEEAICFLKNYFKIIACDYNEKYTQEWIDEVCKD